MLTLVKLVGKARVWEMIISQDKDNNLTTENLMLAPINLCIWTDINTSWKLTFPFTIIIIYLKSLLMIDLKTKHITKFT